MSDVRGERQPMLAPDGRGPALVAALAEECGAAERPGAPGKTVRAVVADGSLRGAPAASSATGESRPR
ncbi:hypothetical protein ACFUAC_25655 [Streptomyces sp. NPDC057148]|uniref:hypothetical protein n=1 Tax=unclassified Streptomyces TaxID=2593676 RepID=UPI003626512C